MITKHAEADDAASRSPIRTHVRGRLGVGLGVVVLGGLGALANASEVVDLFNRPWSTIVLVLSIVAAVIGALMLVQHWRPPLDGLTLGAVALTVAGASGLGFVVGYGSHLGNATDAGSSTSSPASTARDVRSTGRVTVGFVSEAPIDLDQAQCP